MKILQINKYHYLRGGAERVFFNTMDLLSEHGHEVVPFCVRHSLNLPSPYDSYFPKADEIRAMGTLRRIGSMGRFIHNPRSARQLERLLSDFRPDVAHLHNIFNGLSLSILPILKRHGIPVVITLHDVRFMCPAATLDMDTPRCINCHKTGFIKCVMHNCQNSIPISVMGMIEMLHKEHIVHYDKFIDKYILLNRKFQDFFARRHPWFKTKGVVLYNFLSHFTAGNTLPEPKRGHYLLFAGRLTPEKGICHILESAKALPDVEFRIAGDGPLRNVLETSGLKNVHLLGHLDSASLRDQIEEAGWVLVPSDCMENNPMAVIEANAMAKPVIASNMGGIPEIVSHNTTGLLFDIHKPGALTEMIKQGLEMTDADYLQMAQNALVYAQENFSASHHYDALMNIYRSVGAVC